MRLAAALCVAACALAACGKGSSGETRSTGARHTAGEQAYASKLRALCVQAAKADASVPLGSSVRSQRRGVPMLFDDYARFVRGLRRLRPPASLARDHRARLRIARSMLGAIDTLRPTIAAADQPALAGAFDLVRQAYGRDDTLDARLALVDCISVPRFTTATDAYPPVRSTSLPRASGYLNRICIDNASRSVYARRLLGVEESLPIEAAGAERLARLIGAVGRPTDAGARYTAWTDSLRTVSNFLRLASAADGDKARAFREQASRTAAAARKTAAQLGLSECAKGDAAAAPSAAG